METNGEMLGRVAVRDRSPVHYRAPKRPAIDGRVRMGKTVAPEALKRNGKRQLPEDI